MRPVDRRTFLKDATVASAAAAASVAVPGMASPTVAAPGGKTQAPTIWKKTPCRLCGVGCGLLVGIEDGRAVAVKGDPDSPVSKGTACVKGYYSVQALYGRDRITRAQVRRDGAMVEVPLAHALDLIAQKLQDTVRQHGKDSVALYGSAQWTIPDAYVASKLFKGGLGTNNVETSTRVHGASAMAGLETSFGLDGAVGCYEDIDNADVFVLWDDNLAETEPVLFSRMLARQRANRAVRIIHVSTRTTRTSYAADEVLLHRPHTELAIANAVAHELVAGKLVHREFVDRYVTFKQGRADLHSAATAAVPVAEIAADATWADYVASLAEFTPDRVQKLSGVPGERIRWLASLYGDRARRVMSVWGTEVNQDVRGTWLNNVLHNLHLLVGKVGAPGNSPFCTTGQPSGGCSVHDAGTLTHTLPGGLVQNEADRRRAAEVWGVPAERIDPHPTCAALPMFQAVERGDIRFLWIQGTNPMVSLPNLDRYRAALARGNHFVVVSEVYPTATTDIADVVLPAALWIEREGIFANGERRLQHFERMIDPPGEAASDAWLMIEVGRRLGFEKLFPWDRERYVEQIWEEYGRFLETPRHALPPFSELRANPGVLWPYPKGSPTRWRYNTEHDPAADRARGAFDFYGHPDHRAWIWLRPYEAAAEAPDRAYPFWLGTGAVLEHWGTGSLTQRIPTLHRSIPHAYVEIHRDDAARLGVRDGERVRLASRRGSIDVEARLNYRSQPAPGQLFVPTFDEAVPVNRLTLDAVCPLSGQPDAAKCAVRVERSPAASGP
jgi:nitrate reductase NapA